MPRGPLPARPHLTTVLGALISLDQLINALADSFYTQVVLFYQYLFVCFLSRISIHVFFVRLLPFR